MAPLALEQLSHTGPCHALPVVVFVVVTGSCRPFLPSARQRHVYKLLEDDETSEDESSIYESLCELLCCTWYFMAHNCSTSRMWPIATTGVLMYRGLSVCLLPFVL